MKKNMNKKIILTAIVLLTIFSLRILSSKTSSAKLQGKWVLESIPEITLEFGKKKLNGKATCNNYFASYKIDKDNITMSPVSSTKKMCRPPKKEKKVKQESNYLKTIRAAKKFEIKHAKLILHCEPQEGNKKLVFIRPKK
ncbi:META domain-containing protein [Candidatus Dependentiae bacterium]